MRWLLLSSLLLTACASTTEVSTRYLAEDQPAAARHLLVVARTPEKEFRKEWEDRCAEVIAGDGLKVTRSYRALPLWYEPGTQRLEEWARNHGADAILVGELTRLVLPKPDLDHPELLNTGRGELEDPIGEPEWSFFIGRKEKKEDSWPIYQEIFFQLIDADGRGLWSGNTLTHEANALDAIAASQCKALRKSLSSLNLLPGRQ